MNEEIEYAEMLEIPVSTVSVTEKRRKFRKNKGDLKEKLISKVNDKAAGAASAAGAAAIGAAAEYPAYSADFSGAGAASSVKASEVAAANETAEEYSRPYYSEFNTVTIENDRGCNGCNFSANGEYSGGVSKNVSATNLSEKGDFLFEFLPNNYEFLPCYGKAGSGKITAYEFLNGTLIYPEYEKKRNRPYKVLDLKRFNFVSGDEYVKTYFDGA